MKSLFRIFFLSFLILLIANVNVRAQDVVAGIKADTNRILIGQPVNITLQLSQPAGLQLSWPVFTDSLGGMEILQVLPVDTLKTDDPSVLLRSQVIKVSAFDSGVFVIPPVVFGTKAHANVNSANVETDPLEIQVFTVPVDTTKDIRDIRNIEAVPYDYTLLIIIAVSVIVIAVISWYLYRRYKRRKASQVENISIPAEVVPAHVEALQALKQLEQEKLWQNDQVKAYHTRLTDIVRYYIERRWNVNAMEFTTDEIIRHSFAGMLQPSVREELERILRLADLVKFARMVPLSSENESSMEIARRFVNVTAMSTSEHELKKDGMHHESA